MPFSSLATRSSSSLSPLAASKMLLAQGMKNQQLLARIATENFTNADSTASQPGGEPYRRKVVIFQQMVDPHHHISLLHPQKITFDQSPFPLVHNPSHPAADEKGYVQKPNVNPIVESIDFREAMQTTSAMAQIYASVTTMENRNHDLMRKI